MAKYPGESEDKPRSGTLIAVGCFALLGSCTVGPMGCAYVGRHRAESTCAATAVGSDVDAFRERAKQSMDRVWDDPNAADNPTAGRPRQVTSMVSGFVFLRYFCIVEHVDGKVTSKRVTSLD